MWALFLFSMSTLCAAFNLTWGTPPLSLDRNPPPGDTDGSAFIALDPEGNAVASWTRTERRGASEHVWGSFYNHSLRMWTGAVKISGEATASNSHMALDAEGNALFVWQEGFPSRICFRALSKSGIWMPDLSQGPEEVHFANNAQQIPQIAVTPEGEALLVWEEKEHGVEQVHSAKKSKNSGWVYLGRVSSGKQKAHLIPFKSFAQNSKGKAIAAWEDGDQSVMASLFCDGAWNSPVLIAGGGARYPSTAMDEKGDALIVWVQKGAILSKAFRRDLLSGSFSRISHPDYVSDRPHVGIDQEGNGVVVFERYNSLHKFITAATLKRDSSVWSSATDISGPSPLDVKSAGYPYFAMNRLGDGVAVWKTWEETNQVIQGAGFSLGSWSSVKTLSSPSADAGSLEEGYDVSVALNETGNILAAWTEDPEKRGSQLIKTSAGVGLANLGPLPPVIQQENILEGIATGLQVKHRFPAHTDIINILSWHTDQKVSHFRVYRGSLSSLVGTTQEPYFEDHQRTPKKRETYLITSIDSNKQESSPMTIVVHPLDE